MIGEEATEGLDFGTLRLAIEARDPDALTGFYAEDAYLRIVHASLPDGPAFELRGRAQIERYLRAICDQEMSCSVEDRAVVGPEGTIEFQELCEYPNGTPISVRTELEVEGGLIASQTDLVERADSDQGSER